MKKICWMAFLIVLTGVVLAQSAICDINKIADLKHNGGKLGACHALIIGIDRYKDSKIPELKGVENCAKSFADVLKTKYGFSTDFLMNKKATKENLLKKIERLTGSVGKNGTVIFYFAGRGEVGPAGKKSWWYPVDAQKGNYASYIDCESIQNAVRTIPAKDVLLISDSAYADVFFGSVHKLPSVTEGKYYLNLYNKKSRWAMSSGNNYPDHGQTKGCSTFTGQIIRVLKENTRPYLSVQQVFQQIKKTIRKNSLRPPRCRSLKNTGDRGGELVFVMRAPKPSKKEKAVASVPKNKKKLKKKVAKAKKPVPEKRIAASRLSIRSNIKGAKIRMDGVAIGSSPLGNFEVPPGSHKIEVAKEGYIKFNKNILAKRGEKLVLTPELKKEKIVKNTGKLFLTTEPVGAAVIFSDKALEYASGMTITKGTYQLEISLKHYEPQFQEISIVAGEETRMTVKLKPVQTIKLKSLGSFVLLNPGSFMMGSPDNELMRNPNEIRHKVSLGRRIYMQAKEVTVGQWRKFIKSTRYKTEAEAGAGANILVDYNWENDSEYSWGIAGFPQDDTHPVVSVSWNDARAFIKWLNKKSRSKLKFRLPSEAEWEYACRSGSETIFSYGNCLTRAQANFDGNSKWNNCPVGKSSTGTLPAGSHSPNAWGLYDMHGNVKEWCNDWFGDYPSGEVTDPKGPAFGTSKVIRGGGWTDYVYNSRSAKRMNRNPGESYSDTGFRLVIELP